MIKKNIAIIGAGGAGAVAAWSLNKVHNITLFEAEPHIGGHAFSGDCEVDGNIVGVDMGVEFFSEKQAPNLCALLEHFGVETFVAPLSFAASFDESDGYWSNIGFNGSLWNKIREECNKFHIQMHEVMHKYDPTIKKMTLGQFLKENNYSDTFIYKALFPLLTTFSSCQSPLKEYSLTFCSLSFNMGLLSFFHPTYWRKARGGIGAYLKIIEENLKGRIYLNAPIEKVIRNTDSVTLLLKSGEKKNYDEVIFATHADVALSILDNPTLQEKEVLGGFEYSHITSILHTDESVLAPNLQHRAYIEYNSIGQDSNHKIGGSLTRILNQLDLYKHIKTPILVTFDPKKPIARDKIISEKKWKLPKLRPIDMARKLRIRSIQGQNHTWYCGTDTTYTGHEGAILSGLVLADILGAKYPFATNDWAKIQYDIVKGIMGLYNASEQFNNLFTNSIFKVAKGLGLHKSQISKVLLDMYA